MRVSSACSLVLVTLILGDAGCAPPATGTKVPAAGTQPAVISSVARPANSGLAQYGMGDAPTSGEGLARPKMNTAAAQAYGAAMQAFQRGDLEGARVQFAKAGDADPKAFQAFYSLGVVRERLGDTGGAGTAYRKALTVVEDYEPAIVAYGVMLARLGKLDEAESFLKDKQAKMPRSAAVVAALAEVKSIKGDSGEAQRLAQDALKKNPDYRPAMETLARDHYRNRRLDLALYTLKGILDGYGDENPPREANNAQARLLRGLIYKEQGFRREAIDEFKKALDLRPDLVEARLDLATYYLEAGNATEAAPLLEGALRYDRENILAHLNLGDAYRLLGKTGEAKRELEWVLSKDPTVAQANYNLGLLYLFSGAVPGLTRKRSVDEAIVQFEEYKKKKPRTGPDDTDELINRAKSTKAQIEAEEQAGAPAASAATAASSSTPPLGKGAAAAASAGAAPATAASATAASRGTFPAAASSAAGAASAAPGGAKAPAPAPKAPVDAPPPLKAPNPGAVTGGSTGKLPPADEATGKKGVAK